MDAHSHITQAHFTKRLRATRTRLVLFLQRYFPWIQQTTSEPVQELRSPSGRLLSEQQLLDMFQLGKKQGMHDAQKTASPFLQAAYPCPIHGPVYVSGFPNECPQCVVERQGKLPLCGGTPIQVHYNGEFSTAAHRQEIAKTDTQKVADYRPGKRLTVRLYPMHLIPLPPTDVPDSPGTTQTDALFLLDQPTLTDPEQTVHLPRVRKVAS